MSFIDWLDSLITYIRLWWIGVKLYRLDIELQNLEYFIQVNSKDKEE
nr:MAG TPA: hypothetical protein [Caudoviricetes sp.]